MTDNGASSSGKSLETKRRRTQAERSQETRRRVCQATLDALVEVGYERISTPLVADKAGVSRGALTHQFPTRNDLLVAAFQYLVDIWRDNYPFNTVPDLPKLTIDELVDSLWEQIFSTRLYISALELMLAARQDNELGHALRDVLIAWMRTRDKIAVEIIGASPDDTEAADFIQLNLALLRGIAMHQSFDSDESAASRLLETWKAIARRHSQERAREEQR